MRVGIAACVVPALVAIALATPVSAQDSIEEVVVTARKREESLQEIPMTITVFDSEALERHHISDLRSVSDYTPGITFDQGYVQQDTRPQIRGLPATRGRPPVAILVDGIDVSSESMQTAGGGMLANMQLIDAERIEVVKGPQSALYGRVAFGGAVNYVTKLPGENFEGDVTADVGDYGMLDLRVALGGPVTDNFGVRFTAAHASHDGYYTDATSGAEVGTSESTGFSLVGHYTPSDRWDVQARVMYSESEWSPRAQYALMTTTGQSEFLPMPADLIGVPVGGAPLPAGVFIPNRGDLKGLDQVELSLNPLTGQPHRGSTLDSLMMSLIVDYQLTDTITLTSWTGITDADALQDQDADFYGQPWTPQFLPAPGGVGEPLNFYSFTDLAIETSQVSQELRLSDLESDGIRWAVGYQYWREDVAQLNRNSLSVLFGIPGLTGSAGLNLALQGGLPPAQNEWRDTEHQSFYGLIEYDFSDRLTGSLEARYSDEDFDQGWLVGGIGAFGFVAPFLPFQVPFNVGSIDKATTSDDFFTPRATLEYQYSDDMLMYGTVSKGAKPGGVSSIFGTNSQTGRYFPEELWNYEFGIKTALADGAVLLNAAVFFMDYSDRQINTLEPSNLSPTGFALFTRNQGAAEVRGLEMDVTWGISDAWTITGAYTFLDTEVTDGRTTTTGALAIATAGNCELFTTTTGSTGCTIDTTGQELERIPEHEVVLSSLYRRPLTGEMDLAFDLTVRYQDERSIAGAGLHIFPSFTMVDTRIGVETERWSAYVYADNLFDDDTIKSGQSYGDFGALGNLAITTFAPDKRQVGLRVNYSFGE